MRRTIALYLSDGSTEYVIGEPEDVLKRIIREKLGSDCEELFREIIDAVREDEEDKCWDCGENHRKLLNQVREDLRDALAESDLDRDDIESIYETLNENL